MIVAPAPAAASPVAASTAAARSALCGNFYTATPVTYPITVSASDCPYDAAMSGSVQAPASCNSCHNSTFRVHLP